MKLAYAAVALVGYVLATTPLGFAQDTNASEAHAAEVGSVTSVAEGSLYIGGLPHSIATVDTGKETKRVAVPTMGGSMQPLQVGEKLIFSGPSVYFDSHLIVNTHEGYLYRESEKSMAAFMTDMMSKAQAQAEEYQRTGIPNAVPSVILETPEQLQEREQDTAARASERHTDLWLLVLSLVTGGMTLAVAALAYGKVPRIVTAPWRWIKLLSKKRVPETEPE